MKKADDMAAPECPTKADLSAWIDGEAAEDIDLHVKNCRACQQTVDFYASIDGVIRNASRPPDNLAERIHAKCVDSGIPKKRPLYFVLHSPYAKAAAAIIIAAAVTVIGRYTGVMPHSSQETDSTLPDQTAFEEYIVTGPMAYAGADGRNEPAQFIRLVSAGRREAMLASSRPLARQTQNVLPQTVRHVWVVDDLDTARQLFLKSVPLGCSWSYEKSSDKAISFKAVLTDQEVQALVDNLGRRGWALISPAFPQPGQIDQLRMTGREVLYIAEIVAQ